MKKLAVAVPSSILSVEPGLLLKTIRVFQVIRYSSIYGVSDLIIYRDPYTSTRDHKRFSKLFAKIHRYLSIPPYLRRKTVPLDKDLRYVGVVPPLRLNVFDVSSTGYVGEKRLGSATRRFGELYVDVGLDREFKAVEPDKCMGGDLVYVQLESLDPPIARCLDEKPYTGPSLLVRNSLGEVLEAYSEHGVRIATSRHGAVPSVEELRSLNRYEDILVLFGSPRHGLYEIAEREGYTLEKAVDHVWNTIPGQRVKTIRTEEALISTLAVINIFINR